ncbi:hypothetical protein LXL04_031283 [Taraxacum kok-saghyz]
MSPINCYELHKIFKILDKNGDGLVSIEELEWFLKKTGVQISLEELQTLVGNTSLDLMDFWVFYDVFNKQNASDHGHYRSKEVDQEMLEGDIVKAFQVFDMNGDGFISSEQLERTLSRLGLWDEHCGKSCRSMIEFYDTNNDGVLDFHEFKNMLLMPMRYDTTST